MSWLLSVAVIKYQNQKQLDEERVCFGGRFHRDSVHQLGKVCHHGRSRTLADHVSVEKLYRINGKDIRSSFHGHLLCHVIFCVQGIILKKYQGLRETPGRNYCVCNADRETLSKNI